jgi:hypothetical protein
MDDINVSLNCVTTECGHCFHSSCLMRNVAHNGFGCPYCRAVMAETPKSEEEEDDDWDEEEVFDDYALRGFRLFFNNVNGIQQEEEDIIEENNENEEYDEYVMEPIVKPSPILISNKLSEKGITMEHLVKILLMKEHVEYDENEDEYSNINDDIFGKIRIIISNYDISQEPIVQEPIVQEPIVQVDQELISITNMDNSAQPKNHSRISISRRNLPNFHI